MGAGPDPGGAGRDPAGDAVLDPSRLEAIGDQLGRSVADVAATLRAELTRALDEIDAGLAAGDAEMIALAAHAARNSALMIDARPTLAVLDGLEVAARDRDLAAAATEARRLRDRWGPLREQLDHLTSLTRCRSR